MKDPIHASVRRSYNISRSASCDINTSNCTKADAAIPAVFSNFGFVLLKKGQKIPIERDWQNKPRDYDQASQHIQKCGNVGIIIKYPYGLLDQDAPDAFQDVRLPKTTCWETRPGRTVYLLRWTESEAEIAQILQGLGKNPDTAQLKLFSDGHHVGEIKLQRTQQVIPPSHKIVDGERVDYRMVYDAPPAEISFKSLIQDLQRLGISFSERPHKVRLDSSVNRLTQTIEAGSKAVRDRNRKAEEFLQRAIAEAEAHYKKTNKSGIRNDMGFWLAQQLRDLGLDPEKASEYMIRYQRSVQFFGGHEYTLAEAIKTLESAYRTPPRDPPRKPSLDDETEVDPDGLSPEDRARIHQKAMDILLNGDPINYIVDSCSRIVVGGQKSIRKQICCISVQNIVQSQGLHRGAYGESGSGKTHVTIAFTRHLPPEMVVFGSMSSLAVFYHRIPSRTLVVVDDYAGGNETLDTIMKQTSSDFHSGYKHRTVIKQRPVTLEIGSEITWFVTSVDPNQDIQVLNRQIPDNIDDSVETTIKVNQRILERYGKGEAAYPVDESVLISREIFRILRSEPLINVRIPFYERIKWFDNSNRRNLSMFLDLVIAHTGMYRYQRERDADGFYLATEEDFMAACELMFGDDRDAEEILKRLSKKELQLLQFIKQNPRCTQGEMAAHLKISLRRVRSLLYGKDGNGGLCQKVGIEEINETLRDGDRSIHRKVYQIVHDNQLAAWGAVVRLKPLSGGQGDPGTPNGTLKRTLNGTPKSSTGEIEDVVSIDRYIVDTSSPSQDTCGNTDMSQTGPKGSHRPADSDFRGPLEGPIMGPLGSHRPADSDSKGPCAKKIDDVDYTGPDDVISELCRRGDLTDYDRRMLELLVRERDHGAPVFEIAQKMKLPPKDIRDRLKYLESLGLVRNRGRDPKEPHDGDHWVVVGGD